MLSYLEHGSMHTAAGVSRPMQEEYGDDFKTTAPGPVRELLNRLNSGLTVRMIMTSRSDFMACAPTDTVAEVVERNRLDRFSYIPVMRESACVGLLHAARWFDDLAPTSPVSDYLEPLSEVNLIGGNASILDFVIAADSRPCRLVVSGERIDGLVSLSDLQHLPVRSSLFAMITAIELCMADLIRLHHPELSWLDYLTENRSNKIRDEIARSQREDGYVDALLFTQFSDKGTIIRKSLARELSLSSTYLNSVFHELTKLRNNLAHANHYAATPSEGKHVCKVVRDAFRLLHTLENGVQGMNTAPA